MISYCICVYRPRLFYILLEDLIRKTSAPYEILLWLNSRAPDLEGHIWRMANRGVPISIVGSTKDNVGMVGYKMLFQNAKYPLIAQVHDDVLCVSRRIAETATEIFKAQPKVKQIVADVIQDAFTTGGRPADSSYTAFDEARGLFKGPVDGWFSIYHRSILNLLQEAPYTPHFYLGSYIQMQLKAMEQEGLLCKKMKVFHIAGPAYSHLFETTQTEVRKYGFLGNQEMASLYSKMDPSEIEIKQMAEEYIKGVNSLETFGK